MARSSPAGGNPGDDGNQQPPGNPDAPGFSPGPSSPDPGPDMGKPVSSAIVVDAISQKGQFTAMTLGANGNLYAAETVYDNGTGGAAAGTGLYEIVPGATQGKKSLVLAGTDIGIALSLAYRGADASGANLVWMDGVGAKGDLKTSAGGVVSVLSQHVAGAELLAIGSDLYAESDTTQCVSKIDGATHTSTGVHYSNPLQGGNGFHVVGDMLYGADNNNVFIVRLGIADITTLALPAAVKGDGTLPPVFDVTADAAGNIFLATRVGVWMRDPATETFFNLYGKSQVQQIEETAGFLYANVIGQGLVEIQVTGGKANIITNNIAINTRFAIAPQRVHWISASETSILHYGFEWGG